GRGHGAQGSWLRRNYRQSRWRAGKSGGRAARTIQPWPTRPSVVEFAHSPRALFKTGTDTPMVARHGSRYDSRANPASRWFRIASTNTVSTLATKRYSAT